LRFAGVEIRFEHILLRTFGYARDSSARENLEISLSLIQDPTSVDLVPCEVEICSLALTTSPRSGLEFEVRETLSGNDKGPLP
jgi:hypothetical protein